MSDPELAARRYDEEEVVRLLRRAIELQREEPVLPGPSGGAGLTLAELEEVGAEAGIDPSHLRRAAAELEGSPVSPDLAMRLAGAPISFVLERTAPGELSEAELEELVPLLRAHALGQGGASVVGKTLTWTSRSDANTSSQQVLVSSVDGRTTIRIDERLGGYAGALFGGLMGGGGIGLGLGGGVALGLALGSAAVAVALPVVLAGGGYAAARAIFRSRFEKRRRRMEELLWHVVERVERQAGPSPADRPLPSGRPSE